MNVFCIIMSTNLRKVSNIHLHVTGLAGPVQPLHVHIQSSAIQNTHSMVKPKNTLHCLEKDNCKKQTKKHSFQ